MQIPTPSCTSMSLVRGHNLQVVCQTADVAYETSHGRCLMWNVSHLMSENEEMIVAVNAIYAIA